MSIRTERTFETDGKRTLDTEKRGPDWTGRKRREKEKEKKGKKRELKNLLNDKTNWSAPVTSLFTTM